MGKSCFFIGSHDAPERIMEFLEGAVEVHIMDDGVTDFYVGQYGNFDRMAARAVMNAKRQYPHIRLFLVQVYPFDRKQQLPEGVDDFVYPEGVELTPKRFAILTANQYMIDRVDQLISYVDDVSGNSRKLLDYAKRRIEQKAIKHDDLYSAVRMFQKPWNLVPEKTVLLTSYDNSYVPREHIVQMEVCSLIRDGFSVMIVDLSSPFGQLAMEALLKQRQHEGEFTICCYAGKSAVQRNNARDDYSSSDGYARLCVLADCAYYYENPQEVCSSAGFVCTEMGRVSMAEAADLFSFHPFLPGNSML